MRHTSSEMTVKKGVDGEHEAINVLHCLAQHIIILTKKDSE